MASVRLWAALARSACKRALAARVLMSRATSVMTAKVMRYCESPTAKVR